MMSHQGLRVLFLALEFPDWGTAHHVSYTSQLGIEEGLRTQGVEVQTITTPWFSRAHELCRGRKFDQVWIEIARHETLDKKWLEWMAGLAPVRIGFMVESLDYTDEERKVNPFYEGVKERVLARLQYLTHVACVDEEVAEEINSANTLPAIWWPQAIPRRFIKQSPFMWKQLPAIFSGSLYGERKQWLQYPALNGLLVHQPSPEQGTLYPHAFRGLHLATRPWWQGRMSGAKGIFKIYLHFLRVIRRRSFARWLAGMENGCAVVNLPACVKAYAGRVVEGMAAGRPILSWEVPERPKTKTLFENGREILLYNKDDPAQLAAHIERLLTDREFAQSIVVNARHKIERFHTMEMRTQQILDWSISGDQPIYS
jgi:hypothetical protein